VIDLGVRIAGLHEWVVNPPVDGDARGRFYAPWELRACPANAWTCDLCERNACCWDHCHRHGIIRGAVCSAHNAAVAHWEAGNRKTRRRPDADALRAFLTRCGWCP
jgi:hypothetical protein